MTTTDNTQELSMKQHCNRIVIADKIMIGEAIIFLSSISSQYIVMRTNKRYINIYNIYNDYKSTMLYMVMHFQHLFESERVKFIFSFFFLSSLYLKTDLHCFMRGIFYHTYINFSYILILIKSTNIDQVILCMIIHFVLKSIS